MNCFYLGSFKIFALIKYLRKTVNALQEKDGISL